MMKSVFTLLAGAAMAGASVLPAAAQSGTITVYTSQPSEQMDAVVRAFNEDYPEIEVEVFRSGTTEVMNKLMAEFEAGNPQADIVLIADATAATQLKNDDRLLAYEDAPVDSLPAEVVDPDMTFFGTKLITTGIIYNTDLVEEAPTSWKDLADAGVASKLIMPSPLYSGAAVIHVGTMVQQPEFGWDYYETLAENGAVAGRGNGSVVEAVARGEKAYGIIIEYMAMNAKNQGSPVEFVFPEEGVSAITQPVAILKTTDNEEAAKAFVDWQLSQVAQQQSVEQGYFPIFEGVEPPAGYPEVSSLRILPTDAGQILQSDEENKKEFAELFGG
ncbi:ABC transporter substrate-binding protein [Lutibaculum baratangense]|uniref:Periplasmic substrate-binding protein, ABC-type iron transporter n=1 Tax=Lutibaculum baratangense AMV1 TaxID=631454 RepID=V4TAC9_9HYPH|nr:ABC transporter substrate-binding protein [Lutibaculum baratangense]ESR23393.1 periplasmic substrate-binding protein, ABC-type iron transporter [Lutibaculum baratangense AMV1]